MSQKTQAQKNKEKCQQQRIMQLQKKDSQISNMNDEEILNQLKLKSLPTFGTKDERRDRLKKALGIGQDKSGLPKSNVVEEIEKMKQKREERRLLQQQKKQAKAALEAQNIAQGRQNIDVDFQMMVEKERYQKQEFSKHPESNNLKISVCIRKRPLFDKEKKAGELDVVSCAHPKIMVHECKLKVDGITKFVDNTEFNFDHAFNENDDTLTVYNYTLRPLVELICSKGIVTCFAYGQTESGKTYTMQNIQKYVVNDLFAMTNTEKYKNQNIGFYLSSYEIYGGRLYDLLNNKNQVFLLEDKNNNVQVQGLIEKEAMSVKDMLNIIEQGNRARTTKATVLNDTSSRSHSICQIVLKQNKSFVGKLLLVDLAGSERAQDAQSNNRQRRLEGAEINKSLLGLKECIRAMDQQAQHIPFRASKLTLALRDSFLDKSSKGRIVMIGCVLPRQSSTDHSLNTLRYADRIKDRGQGNMKVTAFNFNQELYNEVQQIQYDGQSQYIKPVQQVSQQQVQQIEKKPEYKQVQSLQKIKQNNYSNNQSQESDKQVPEKRSSSQRDSDQIKNQKQISDKQKIQKKQLEKLQHQEKIAKSNQEEEKKYCKSNDKSKNSSEDDEEDIGLGVDNKDRAKEDVKCMKETMKFDKNRASKEFFDFHDKVNKILEDQEEVFAIHMAAIKEDAKLLTQESELISNAQGVGFIDFDIDLYVKKMDYIIKKKLKMYNLLNKKINLFKLHLQEEEEFSSKIKDTVYY